MILKLTTTSKPHGRFGLYDMHGNVWEWVKDDYHGSYDGAPNDGSVWIGDLRDSRRVIRGGSWMGPAGYCRAAARKGFGPGSRGYDLGFRLVLPPGQQK